MSGQAPDPMLELIHQRLLKLLEDETALGDRLDTRATWLGGSAGLVLALSVAARKLINDLGGALEQPAQDIGFVAGVVALLGAVAVAAWSVWPAVYWRPAVEEPVTWISALGLSSADDVRRREAPRVLQGWALAQEANTRKIDRTRAAVVLLSFGVAAVAFQALVGAI